MRRTEIQILPLKIKKTHIYLLEQHNVTKTMFKNEFTGI